MSDPNLPLLAQPQEELPPPPPSGPPFFAVYYLWMTTAYWRFLGPNYPMNSPQPYPLPASYGVEPNVDTLTADETVLTNNYVGNALIDVDLQYGCNLPGVIETDCDLAYATGLKGFAVNWADHPEYTQYLVRMLNKVDAMRAEGKDFWVMLDFKGIGGPSQWTIQQLADGINLWASRYGNRPCVYKMKSPYDQREKPLVTWSGSDEFGGASGFDTTYWAGVWPLVRDNVTLLGQHQWAAWDTIRPYFDGNANYWSTQNPYRNPQSFAHNQFMADGIHADGKIWGCPLIAGYDDRILRPAQANYVPRKNGETLQRIFDGNKPTNPEFWFFISWNEVPENSCIRPLTRYGIAYVDKLRDLIANAA